MHLAWLMMSWTLAVPTDCLEPGFAAAPATLDLRFEPLSTVMPSEAAAGQTETHPSLDEAPRPHPAFGAAESRRWMVHGALASNFDDTDHGLAGAGLSFFLADDFSVDFEANALYFDQAGNNAAAGHLNVLLRWHMFHDEPRTWTMYAETGVGLLFATDDVPEDGSRFNFTPQLGAGFSFDVGSDTRLFTGLRWFHISNANLYEQNPGRDAYMLYAGLSWPF